MALVNVGGGRRWSFLIRRFVRDDSESCGCLPFFVVHYLCRIQWRETRDRWDRREGKRKVRGQDSRRIESFGTRRWIIGIQTGDSVLRADSQLVDLLLSFEKNSFAVRNTMGLTHLKTCIEWKFFWTRFNLQSAREKRTDPLRGGICYNSRKRDQRNFFREHSNSTRSTDKVASRLRSIFSKTVCTLLERVSEKFYITNRHCLFTVLVPSGCPQVARDVRSFRRYVSECDGTTDGDGTSIARLSRYEILSFPRECISRQPTSNSFDGCARKCWCHSS